MPRLLELLGLPASLGGTVKLRAREVKTVVLSLARGLPGRMKLSDAALTRALPQVVDEF